MLTTVLTLALSAFAIPNNCGALDAPDTFKMYSCSAVCTYTDDAGADTINCTLTGGGYLYASTHYKPFSHDHSFWGTINGGPMTGTRFCCAFNEGADEVDLIDIDGSSSADHIYLHDGTEAKYLYDPGGSSSVQVRVYSWAGNDYIEGVPLAGSIKPALNSGDGNDNIYCLGACDVAAGDDDDHVTGSDESDDISGQAGDDYIAGLAGSDILEAGPYGDPTDVNYICGDDDDDDIYGDDYIDYLWGGSDAAYDYILAGTGTDYCLGTEEHECELNFSSSDRPSQCPAL